MMGRPSSEVGWALLYAALILVVAVVDRVRNPDEPGTTRRVIAFLALLLLALVAAFVEVRSRPRS